jgi:hypothetical protein
MPTFPNVPQVPGVPPLARNPLAQAITITALVVDAVSFFAGFLFPQWGIFTTATGLPVITADNVVDLTFKRDYVISRYPQEQGSFADYDKVQEPFEIRTRFSTGGSVLSRQSFLNSVDAAVNSLTLFDIVVPETVYTGVNLTHYDYTRTGLRGVGLLVVDIFGEQVRQTATAAFGNTQQPNGADPTSGGLVQTTTPTPSQMSQAQVPPVQ